MTRSIGGASDARLRRNDFSVDIPATRSQLSELGSSPPIRPGTPTSEGISSGLFRTNTSPCVCHESSVPQRFFAGLADSEDRRSLAPVVRHPLDRTYRAEPIR
jgi:hypothetical protein